MTNLRKFALPMMVIAFLGYRFYSNQPASREPKVVLAGVQDGQKDPCFGKGRCLVVYVAPWCPSCQQASALIDALRNRSSNANFGVKIIAGLDEPPALMEYAKTLGPGTYIDYDKQYFRGINGGGVPAWFLLSEGGNVLSHFSGLISSSDMDRTVHHVLTKKLGMDAKYF